MDEIFNRINASGRRSSVSGSAQGLPRRQDLDRDMGFVFPDEEPEFAGRRESMYRRSMRTVEDRAPAYVEARPDFSNIRLEKLDVKSAVAFFKSVARYCDDYDLTIPAQRLVSPRVKIQLLMKFRSRDLTEENFHLLAPKDLLVLVQEYLRPRDVFSFNALLQENCIFTYEREPREASLAFFSAVFDHSLRFKEVYDFLAERTPEYCVPRTVNRANGSIKVFLESFKERYKKIIVRICADVLDQEYSSFYTFLIAFQEVVDAFCERQRTAFQDLHRMDPTPAVPAAIAKRPPFPASASNASSSAAPQGGATNFQRPFTPTPRPERRLAHIQASSPDDEDEVYDDFVSVAPPTQVTVNSLAAPPRTPAGPTAFNATNAGASKAQGRVSSLPNGCFTTVVFGVCNRPGECNRDHSASASRGYWRAIVDRLAVSEFAAFRIDSTKSVRVLEPAAAAPSGADDVPTAQNLSDEMDVVAAARVLNTDEEALCMFTSFCHSLSTSLPPMHAHATIAAAEDSPIALDGVRTLFDTGASSDNYISQSFVDDNKDFFEPLLTPCNDSVVLGDSATRLHINEKVSLHVSFTVEGVTSAALVSFAVMAHSTNKLIVGLPSIARNFIGVFAVLLEHARNTFAGCSVLNAGDVVEPWALRPEVEAIEETNTPTPCSFTGPLDATAATLSDARAEFESLFETHVDPGFAAATPVLQMLTEWGWRVFVPDGWRGIQGIPPLELTFTADLPRIQKPSPRRINPSLLTAVETEFRRLVTMGMYVASRSPIASCLVVAPKATAPFIRLCVDYRSINRYVLRGHYPIPWGQFEPMFMPEGVSPASAILQEIVAKLFYDFLDWTIAIFDNLLVLAESYDDAYTKLERVLKRCLEYNVVLKFSKSWMGFDHCSFFGYVCSADGYTLSEERKRAILSIPFPDSTKKMQRFLGMANYFGPFVPNYSALAAPLHDMTRQNFNWEPTTWIVQYELKFIEFKEALLDCQKVHYPDFTADWVLKTDASESGVGGVLLQKVILNGQDQWQPICIVSSKLSDTARKWSVIEAEAYGIFFTVKSMSYLLTGKHFTLCTDHNNLVWIEQSQVPKIIRWRMYLQSFSFIIKHIPRRENEVADYFSKVLAVASPPHPDELLASVHGGRAGHFGVRRTWLRLNEQFPGHSIPISYITDYIQRCAVSKSPSYTLLLVSICSPSLPLTIMETR